MIIKKNKNKNFYTETTCGGGQEPARGWDWRTDKRNGGINKSTHMSKIS